MSNFVEVTDAYGRPLFLRASEIGVIEGARDAADCAGDSRPQRPVVMAYRKLVLASGHHVYVEDTPQFLRLLAARYSAARIRAESLADQPTRQFPFPEPASPSSPVVPNPSHRDGRHL